LGRAGVVPERVALAGDGSLNAGSTTDYDYGQERPDGIALPDPRFPDRESRVP